MEKGDKFNRTKFIISRYTNVSVRRNATVPERMTVDKLFQGRMRWQWSQLGLDFDGASDLKGNSIRNGQVECVLCEEITGYLQ